MADKLDLIIMPIHRKDGVERSTLEGLYTSDAPRGAARGRSGDHFIASLYMTGTATFSAEGQKQLLEGLSRTYFRTSGSVTSALRTAVDILNEFLLDRNLQTASQGLQATALLTIFVVHAGRLYVAQCGETHLFLVNEGRTEVLNDPGLSGYGLGLGKVATVRFTHTALEPGSLALLTPDSPGQVSGTAMQSTFGRNLKQVYRGLVRHTPDTWQALLIQATPGRDKIRIVKPEPLPGERGTPPADLQPREMLVAGIPDEDSLQPPPPPEMEEDEYSEIEFPEEMLAQSVRSPQDQAIAPPPERVAQPARQTPKPTGPRSASREIASAEPKMPPGLEPAPAVSAPAPPADRMKRTRDPQFSAAAGKATQAIGGAFQTAGEQLKYLLRAIISRVLPGNELFTIPASTMIFIAIAVPVILVTAASYVYLQRGRTQQYQEFLMQAEAVALNAQGIPEDAVNINQARAAWKGVLYFVDQAEQYQVTDETRTLRNRAFQVLDQIDQTTRLNFTDALVGGTLGDVEITKMIYAGDSLYLLDARPGKSRVLRLFVTGRGYQYDPGFQCTQGQYGSYIVEALVDMSALPVGNQFDATILAMDANGILVYCAPNAPLLARPLLPPDSNWGDPRAIYYDQGNLYVMDPRTNAVWVYFGSDLVFGDRPSLFFDNNVPAMQDIVSMIVNGNDLFLLHADGRMVNCIYRYYSGDDLIPTTCKDPAPYNDPRSGGEVASLPFAKFTTMLYVPPPGPSIYLLDPVEQAVYHLSLRLTFQRQYRPSDTSLGAPTAFTVGRNRELFLAFGSQVKVATLP